MTVEFAMVAPIFFLLCFASLEFGRLNMMRHVVDNAAYEAARQAILPGATVSGVQNTANSYLQNTVAPTGAVITVSPNPIDDATQEVTVQVDIPMDQNAWVVPSFSAGAIISGSSTLRAERYRGIE